MFVRFLLMVAAVLFCARVVADETAPPAAAATDAFGPRLKELLTVLQQRQLLTPLDPAVDRAVGEALLRQVGCGARYAETAGSAPPPPAVRTVLLRRHYLYAWIPAVIPECAAEVAKALPASGTGNAVEGLIVDLRGTAQGTADGISRLAATLTTGKKPVILLHNPGTAGPAEILAVLLRQQAGAAWVGQPTRGCFAFTEPVTLPSGEVVLLPKPVREFAGVSLPASALKPDMAVEPGPAGENPAGLTAERFETFPERDPALRTALDMLTTVLALQPKEASPAAAK